MDSPLTITRLPDDSLTIGLPIPVVVEPSSPGVFVARMATANVNASGESRAKALDNLADMIAGTYDLLSRLEHNLAPTLARDLAVLRRHVSPLPQENRS